LPEVGFTIIEKKHLLDNPGEMRIRDFLLGVALISTVWGCENCAECDCKTAQSFGSGQLEVYDKWDTQRIGVVVDAAGAVQSVGHVTGVSFVAGGTETDRLYAADNEIFFGIFRPSGDEECAFDNIFWKKLGENFTSGERYDFELETCLAVQPGDAIGFYWNNYGVVSYNYSESPETDTPRYCSGEGTGESKPGSEAYVQLAMTGPDVPFSPSYRIYAFQAQFCSSCEHARSLGRTEDFVRLAKHDNFKRWMMVDQRIVVPASGVIDYVEIQARGHDVDISWSDTRKVTFTMLNDVGGGVFEVVAKKTRGPAFQGYNLFKLNMSVELGQMIGVSWRGFGVVSFDYLERNVSDDSFNQNYYGGEVGNPLLGENVTLGLSPASNKNSPSHRDYAIRYHLCPGGCTVDNVGPMMDALGDIYKSYTDRPMGNDTVPDSLTETKIDYDSYLDVFNFMNRRGNFEGHKQQLALALEKAKTEVERRAAMIIFYVRMFSNQYMSRMYAELAQTMMDSPDADKLDAVFFDRLVEDVKETSEFVKIHQETMDSCDLHGDSDVVMDDFLPTTTPAPATCQPSEPCDCTNQ
jgi:hypothetical protein